MSFVIPLMGRQEYSSPGFIGRLSVELDGRLPTVKLVGESRVIDEYSIGCRPIDWPFFTQH